MMLSTVSRLFNSDAIKTDVKINAVSTDTRSIKKNDLFIALPGSQYHGLSFLSQVVEAGAACIVFDINEQQRFAEQLECYRSQIKQLAVNNVREVAGIIIAHYFQSVSQSMQLIAITGTDGKTSVSRFIAQALSAVNTKSSEKVAVLGTTGNGIWGDLKTSTHTTADVLSMHQMIFSLAQQSAKTVVMEVSSHGLDQGRINGVLFDAAVFTNLSHDHLDYHKTLDAYAEVKRKLFFMPGLNAAVINLDDNYGRTLAKECKDRLSVWGYSTQSDFDSWQDYTNYFVQTSSIKAVAHGFEVTIKTSKGEGELFISLLGTFNVSNVLAVLSVLLINDWSFESALKKLAGISPVPGRMEVIAVNNAVTVVVDFAHTPNALEEACKAVKAHFDGQLWCVFGCGGDRDRSKRPLMARVAEDYADKVVVTSDNPRTENPQKIINEVIAGFDNDSKVKVILDRRDAIAYAIEHAQINDVVLLAGKGHESVQLVAGKSYDFDDRLVARECLAVMQ